MVSHPLEAGNGESYALASRDPCGNGWLDLDWGLGRQNDMRGGNGYPKQDDLFREDGDVGFCNPFLFADAKRMIESIEQPGDTVNRPKGSAGERCFLEDVELWDV